jgi:hypothetical protein
VIFSHLQQRYVVLRSTPFNLQRIAAGLQNIFAALHSIFANLLSIFAVRFFRLAILLGGDHT